MPSVETLPDAVPAPAPHTKPPQSFAEYGGAARVPSASGKAKRAIARSASHASQASSSNSSTATGSDDQPAAASRTAAGSEPLPGPLAAAAVAARNYTPPGGPAVVLNVYDITTPDDPAFIPRLNSTLYHIGVGLYHSGIEVYGVEYAFGGHYDDLSGIFGSQPRRAEGVVYRCSIPLGETAHSEDAVGSIISDLGGTTFQGNSYSLIGNNCNHFAAAFARELGSAKPVPAWVNRIAGFATQVSCLLPDAVEQPLSELAPSANSPGLDRRSMSIAPAPRSQSNSRSASRHSRSSSTSSADRARPPAVPSVLSHTSTVSSPSGASDLSPPATPPVISTSDGLADAYRRVDYVAPPPAAAGARAGRQASLRRDGAARNGKNRRRDSPEREDRMSESPWLSSSTLEVYD